MICPYCGNDNPEDLDICGFCGGPLHPTDAEPHADENPLEPKVTIFDTPPQPQAVAPPYAVTPQIPQAKKRNRTWWLVGCVVIVLLFLCCGISIIAFYQVANRLGANPIATLTSDNTIISVATAMANTMPTSVSTANQDVLLFDDFSDPTSGWDNVDNSDYYTDYFENSYRIIVYTDMSDSWANPGNNVFGDVQVDVDATKNGGPDDNDFGVICRYQNANAFYYAIISSDGYYGILKVTSESTTQLGFDELQQSNAIYQGATTNQIRFDCVGDVLTLYVNDQEIDQQSDSTYSTGNVGLIAGTYDTPGTDILFDNFTVLQP